MTLQNSHGFPDKTRSQKNAAQIKRGRKYRARDARRNLAIENLEERALLALGPTLIAINPNAGTVLQNGDTRNVAPADLTFRFDDGQVLDRATLAAGISIVRTGGAGDPFGSAGSEADIVVVPGFLDIGE